MLQASNTRQRRFYSPYFSNYRRRSRQRLLFQIKGVGMILFVACISSMLVEKIDLTTTRGILYTRFAKTREMDYLSSRIYYFLEKPNFCVWQQCF